MKDYEGERSQTRKQKAVAQPQRGSIILRLPKPVAVEMRADLERAHPFAAERVGFLTLAMASGESDRMILIGKSYYGIPDEQYVPDDSVGARIGVLAIREAVTRTLVSGNGMMHVHMHPHSGTPFFSSTDTSEQPRLIQSLRSVAPNSAHGMLVLSEDSANAWIWIPGSPEPTIPQRLSVVGYPMALLEAPNLRSTKRSSASAPAPQESGRHARQSFLGPASERNLGSARIAIAGYGGGGSHFGQQLAHVGIGHIAIADADHIDGTNLNRLVGGTAADVKAKQLKVKIAARLIRAVNPGVDVQIHPGRWQGRAEMFRECDILVGCVDSFAERHELEVLARRFAIPYIDIGMDIHRVADDPPRMGGQVILSMPGGPCMRCLGFLTENRLTLEAQRYGDTGGRPQVVWANGALASAGVGVIVDLITGWSGFVDRTVYLSYDGNANTIVPHPRLAYVSHEVCPHYPAAEVGSPLFRGV